jgi:uncharacterized protein YegP (UPF0339 family)
MHLLFIGGTTMSRRVLGIGSLLVLSLLLIDPAFVLAADSDALKFEVYADKEKQFRWRLKNGDEILATAGQGYKEKASCKKGIEGIKKGLENDKDKFEIYEDNAKAFRWRLKASNGQIVAAASKGYKDKAACEKIIEFIKKGLPKAEVVEEK